MNSELVHRIESNRGDDKDAMLRGTQNLRESFRKLREAREAKEAKERANEPAEEDASKDTASRSSVLSAIGLGGPAATPDNSPAAAAQDEEIDWDLWQAVVDDSLKVAAEKPNELNRAIQAGIPPTLRGTIWQSMAASKSLELEACYRDVIALPATATAEDARPIFGNHWLWDSSPASSQSSSPKIGTNSPKMDAAGSTKPDGYWGKTIAQLEKVIKRDLGERTSFGKYKVDQKALLNICKAYALFDPEVGYTQGMTFIATVLLLNVCNSPLPALR
jgi:Rab-GTPase-TBC domain